MDEILLDKLNYYGVKVIINDFFKYRGGQKKDPYTEIVTTFC